MLLFGSCHCEAVKFKLHCPHPYPYNLCYCSICRKTAGAGGFVTNLGGEFNTLEILQGEDQISVYQAMSVDPESGEKIKNPGERRFCRQCASCLWLWDPRWPELVHPFASAIDTELPVPPERTHIMLGSKANWVAVNAGENDKQFDEYPEESLAQWHQRLGLVSLIQK